MAEFSIQDAAFTGFRVVREHPKAVAVWGLSALIFSLILQVVFVPMVGPALTMLHSATPQARADPARALAALGQLAPSYALFLVVATIFYSFLYAAMNRSVLRPADDRFGYFRLGGDELRQLGLQLLLFAVFLGAYVGLVLALVLITVLLGLALKVMAAIVAVVGVVAVVCALIFLAVRLSLASALTFDTGRIDLFGSWTLTRGRFWPLFGTYVLVLALVAVVYLLSALVILAVVAALSGGNPMAGMSHPDMSFPGAWLSPAKLAQTVLGAVLSALVWPLMLTPAAAIYRSLAPGASPGAGAAGVFT